jgi:hypothetical protein
VGTDEQHGGGFEVDRHADDQPRRDDLIDPEDVDAGTVEEPTLDREAGILPDPDELPESQGYDLLDADHASADASSRRLLSDEEAERGP